MLKLLRLTTAPFVILLALITGCTTKQIQATSSSPSPQPDLFVEAVNNATSVAILAQKSKCDGNSNSLVSQWEEAIDLMNAVPSSNHNYKLAQEKVANYQQNLNQAKTIETEQNITQGQIQIIEERIANTKAKIEEVPVKIAEIEALLAQGILSDIEGEEQLHKAKQQVLQDKKELLKQIHAKYTIILNTVSKEDIARIDCEIAKLEKTIEGKQSPLVTQASASEHSQEAQAVLEEFLELNSRLKVGINYQDYASQVGDLRIALDQFTQVAEETNISTYHKLEKAFARYKYALDQWSDCSRTDSVCLKSNYSYEWNSAQQWLESAQKDYRSRL